MAVGQQLVIKTKKIQLLVEEWNIVHNARSTNSLADIYDQRLDYYGERMTRKKAISLKKAMFTSKSDYRQKIASDVEYSLHTSGIIKCEFLKEAWENGGWKPYLSYLLVSYRDGRFWVVGESDHATDKSMGYTLNIGEPLELEGLTEDAAAKDSITEAGGSTVASSANPFSERGDMITMKKNYFYMLIGGILGGSLLIIGIVAFVSRKGNKRSRTRNYNDYPSQNYSQRPVAFPPSNEIRSEEQTKRVETIMTPPPVNVSAVPKPVTPEPPLQEATVVEEDEDEDEDESPAVILQNEDTTSPEEESFKGIDHHLKQASFRNYVIGLFKLSNFTYVKPRANSVSPGSFDADDPQPIVEFQGESESGRENFGVQCLYREDEGGPELKMFSQEHLKFNSQFVNEIDLYYLVGVGGAPEKPHGLFLIPAKQLTTTSLTRDQLKNFRKSGLFLYYKKKLR